MFEHKFVALPPQLNNLDPLSVLELFAKLNQVDQIVKENEALRREVQELRKQRDELLEAEGFIGVDEDNIDDFFFAPSFPQDFKLFAGAAELDDEEIQDLVIEASSVDLEEDEFHLVSTGNVLVLRFIEEGKVHTIVAKNFYENTMPYFDTQE